MTFRITANATRTRHFTNFTMRLTSESAKADEIVCDIDGLEAFVQQRMKDGDSIFQTQIQKLVLEYHHTKAAKEQNIEISVLINSSGTILPLKVSLDTTLFALKMRLEYMNPHNVAINSLIIDRTKQTFSSLDTKRALSNCGIRDGDRLIADYSCISHKGVRRIEASGLVAASGFQYISLALHAFMLDEGFQAVVEIKNAKVGFRPLCKELHSGVFLRPNWNCNAGSINLMYKHSSHGADVFMLSCEDMMGSFFASMSVRARAINEYIEFDVCTFVDESTDRMGGSHYTLRNEVQLRGKLSALILKVIPAFHARGKRSQDKHVSIKEIRARLQQQRSKCEGMRGTTSVVPCDPPVHFAQRKLLRVDPQESEPLPDIPYEDPNHRWLTNYAQLAVRDASPMRPPPRVAYRSPAGLPPAPRDPFQVYLEDPLTVEKTPARTIPHNIETDLYYHFAPSVQGGCWQGPNPYFRHRFLEAYNSASRKEY